MYYTILGPFSFNTVLKYFTKARSWSLFSIIFWSNTSRICSFTRFISLASPFLADIPTTLWNSNGCAGLIVSGTSGNTPLTKINK